ncbi:hypothetical protein ACQJBY_002448 [Aegilops geniculata]
MFVANQRTYTVKCYKGRTKSAMYGRCWRKFYDDNKLGKGQMMVFLLDEPSPRVAICVIQVGNGSEDEQPMEEGNPIEDSDSDVEEMERLQAMMVKALFTLRCFCLMRQKVFIYKVCCLSVMISSGFLSFTASQGQTFVWA